MEHLLEGEILVASLPEGMAVITPPSSTAKYVRRDSEGFAITQTLGESPPGIPCDCGEGERKPYWASHRTEWWFASKCDSCNERERLERERKEAEEYQRQCIASRIADLKLSPRQQSMTFANLKIDKHNQKAVEACKIAVAGDKGTPGVFIYGDVGRGKTHLAIASALAAAETKRTALKIVPWMIQDLRGLAADAGDHRYYIENITHAEVLVLDDLGADRITDFAIDQLFLVIDSAYQHETTTIITSNIGLDVIAERLDPRIASRIAEMCVCVKIGGSDRRIEVNVARAK